MKKIEAIIRREKLPAVKEALDAIHCPGMMVWEIEGHGKQKGITEQFRGREFKVNFLPKTKVEIIGPETWRVSFGPSVFVDIETTTRAQAVLAAEWIVYLDKRLSKS